MPSSGSFRRSRPTISPASRAFSVHVALMAGGGWSEAAFT